MSNFGISNASTAAALREPHEPGPTLVPALTIVSHPSLHRVGERFLLTALAKGKTIALTRNAPDFFKPDSQLGTPIADLFVSRTKPVRFEPVENGGVHIVRDPGASSLSVSGEPVRHDLTITESDLKIGVPIALSNRVVLLLHSVNPTLNEVETASPKVDLLGMVGQSSAIGRVRSHIHRVADIHVSVLIRGETGSGKELVASAIHQQSQRARGPFVSVNLGAIPRELAASELFGAQRGAYTGASHDRPGLFHAARGGTLFLDEVGEASPEVQVMLLRVLETGEMYPVGGHAAVPTDVRLIAATDADLEGHIRDGRFKAPLLHRLAGYEIRVPPLRERREDIGLLFVHFAREELSAIGEAHHMAPSDPYAEPWLPAALCSQLLLCPWPGNIRQLRNVTRQLVIGNRGNARLVVDDQMLSDLSTGPPSRRIDGAVSESPSVKASDSGVKLRRKPSEITEAELASALRLANWDMKEAADRLRIPRPSIYDLIAKSPNIRTAGDLRPEEIQACYEACGGDVGAMVERLQVSERALKRRMKELGLGAKRA